MSGLDYVQELRALIGTRPVNLIGAAGIILNQQGEVLLERKAGRQVWSLPGGICELGEALEDTLRREVREETGLHVISAELLEMHSGQERFFTLANGDQFYMYTALYRVMDWAGEPVPDGVEIEELRFFPPGALPAASGPVTARAFRLLLQR